MSNRAVVHPDTIENNLTEASPEVSSTAIDVIWDDDKIEKVSYIQSHSLKYTRPAHT